jgi:hypothetical protein
MLMPLQFDFLKNDLKNETIESQYYYIFFGGGGGRGGEGASPPPWPSIFSVILFLSAILLTVISNGL